MPAVKVTILMCYIMLHVFNDAKAYPHLKDQCADKYGDVVFLLDSSDSIHEEDFPKQLQLVQHVIKRFQVKKDGVHVSVATFASHVHTHFYLQDHYTTDSVIGAVSDIKYSKGATRTDMALKFVRDNILGDGRGGRPGVTKVIIVVTDGLSMDTNNTLMEASISRSLGIKIVSVGVGLGPDDFELRNMASEYEGRKLMFKVDDFNSLREIEEDLTDTICGVMTFVEELADDPEANPESATENDILQECKGKPADVYFTIDSSSSLSSNNFKEILEFIIGSLGNFVVGPDATRVGVVQFSDDIKLEIKLEEDLSKENLKRRIYNLKQLNGKTQTGEVLKFLREHGFKSRNTREEVPRVIVLLTDGQSSDPELAVEESKLLQEMGTYLLAVGIGDHIDYTELVNIASDPKEKIVLRVDDFDALSTFKKVMAGNICHGLHEQTKTEESMAADATRTSSCQSPLSINILYVYDCQNFHIGLAKVLERFVYDLMKEISSHNSKSGIIMNPCKGMKSSFSSYNVHSSTGHMKISQMENVTGLLRKARIQMFSNNFMPTQTFVEASAEGQTQDMHANVVVLFINEHVTYEIHREAERLKFRSHVKLIVVYVGKNPVDWVHTLASKPYKENTIIVSHASDLRHAKQRILQNVCET